RRSSCGGVVAVLTDSGTVRGDEMSLRGGKSDASALGDELRRITMGMSGLGVTLILSDCSRDVVVTLGVDVELPAVGFETLSGELVIRSGSQRATAKVKKNKTIVPTIHTLASAIIGSGDILRPASVLRPGRECIRAPIYTRCRSKF